MKKILVLTDFSDFSEYAYDTGSAIARKAGAELELLHMIKVPSGWKEQKMEGFPDVQKATKQAEANMHMAAHKAENENLEITTKIIYEKDADKLSKHISPREYDLAIVGSEGQNSVKKKILGSIALNVLDNSKVPVLIANKPYSETLFDKILFPSDFDPDVKDHFMSTVQLAKIFKSELHLLYILSTFPEITEEDAEERMMEYVERFAGGVKTTVAIEESKNVETGILDYQRRNNIHLVAMVTHDYPWLMKKLPFSITEKLINSGEAIILSLNVGKR